eukprot:6571326-Prymnesium_polylepis.1
MSVDTVLGWPDAERARWQTCGTDLGCGRAAAVEHRGACLVASMARDGCGGTGVARVRWHGCGGTGAVAR